MSEYPVLLSIIDSEGFWVVKSSIDMCWSWRRGARAGISVLEAKLSEHSARTNNFEEFLSYLAAEKLFDESEAEKFYGGEIGVSYFFCKKVQRGEISKESREYIW